MIQNFILTTQNTETDILTVPAGKKYALVGIYVCNQDSGNMAQFDLHLKPGGESLADKNRVILNYLLYKEETFEWEKPITLGEGTVVSFVPKSATPNLSVHIAYEEMN